MNANELANELADKLEGYGVVYVKFEYRKQAAAMLRQQQAEIEALKDKAHEWYLIAMEKAQEK